MHGKGNEILINVLFHLGCRFVELTAQPRRDCSKF